MIKLVLNKPRVAETRAGAIKAPDTLVKLKEKELENAQKQLSIYKNENAKLKQKLSQSQATKETVSDLMQKLKEIEQSNENLSKEITKMKHSQNIRGKILNRSTKNTHEDDQEKNFKFTSPEQYVDSKQKGYDQNMSSI